MDPSQVIVIERGADWVGWVEIHGHPAPPAVLVIQDEGESAGHLSDRVRRRIARIRKEGGSIAEFIVLRSDVRDAEPYRKRRAALHDAEVHGLVTRTDR